MRQGMGSELERWVVEAAATCEGGRAGEHCGNNIEMIVADSELSHLIGAIIWRSGTNVSEFMNSRFRDT